MPREGGPGSVEGNARLGVSHGQEIFHGRAVRRAVARISRGPFDPRRPSIIGIDRGTVAGQGILRPAVGKADGIAIHRQIVFVVGINGAIDILSGRILKAGHIPIGDVAVILIVAFQIGADELKAFVAAFYPIILVQVVDALRAVTDRAAIAPAAGVGAGAGPGHLVAIATAAGGVAAIDVGVAAAMQEIIAKGRLRADADAVALPRVIFIVFREHADAINNIDQGPVLVAVVESHQIAAKGNVVGRAAGADDAATALAGGKIAAFQT